jgi:crotonobetainyl-CoA:carnitine CoA-transferase CaiB-like acyl-CoA transferase
MLLIQGVIAALLKRASTGRGQLVETSLLDGVSAATMRLSFRRVGDAVVPTHQRSRSNDLVHRGIALTFLTAECSDGRYIQMCARQDHHFRNWLAALDLGHLLEDPRFENAPMGLKTDADVEYLEDEIRRVMRKKTQAEWMDLLSNVYDVGCDPFLTPPEFLVHADMTQNERTVTLDDPVHGPVAQIGPLVTFAERRTTIGRPAPTACLEQGHLADVLAPSVPSHPLTVGPVDRTNPYPLAGKTIIEAAYYLAGPLGATLLAELGARVIKVEPLSGDPYRRSGLEVVHILHGKESIALDLKTERGRDILHRLVARADGLVHSFRPGVPERLGMDYETLHTLNPRLVYLYAGSYGSHGPQRMRPAFHSTPHALSGGGIVQGGEGNPPVDDSYPDPCAGLAVATAMALGLYAQHLTGRGDYLETTMLCATAYVHSERLTRYDGCPELPILDHGQRGFHALNRLYPTKGEGWLCLCVHSEEWLRLCHALDHPEWINDARLRTETNRADNDTYLTSILDGVFGERPAEEWEDLLLTGGVPAVSVGSSFEEFLLEHNLVSSEDHPGFGTYWRLRPRTRFSESSNREGPPSTIGEHTIALLEELGFEASEIDHLFADGVVVGKS